VRVRIFPLFDFLFPAISFFSSLFTGALRSFFAPVRCIPLQSRLLRMHAALEILLKKKEKARLALFGEVAYIQGKTAMAEK